MSEQELKYESFTKAIRAYFEIDASTTIKEYKELTENDKVEISRMMNDVGYTHPQYVAKVS